MYNMHNCEACDIFLTRWPWIAVECVWYMKLLCLHEPNSSFTLKLGFQILCHFGGASASQYQDSHKRCMKLVLRDVEPVDNGGTHVMLHWPQQEVDLARNFTQQLHPTRRVLICKLWNHCLWSLPSCLLIQAIQRCRSLKCSWFACENNEIDRRNISGLRKATTCWCVHLSWTYLCCDAFHMEMQFWWSYCAMQMRLLAKCLIIQTRAPYLLTKHQFFWQIVITLCALW